MRYPYPIGPAPQRFKPTLGCSAVIPHTECDDEEQNADMNREHMAFRHYNGSWVCNDCGRAGSYADISLHSLTAGHVYSPAECVDLWCICESS